MTVLTAGRSNPPTYQRTHKKVMTHENGNKNIYPLSDNRVI